MERRKNAHSQLVEFILLLMKNLLQIGSGEDEYQYIHDQFLVNMIKEEMFDSILFLAQS